MNRLRAFVLSAALLTTGYAGTAAAASGHENSCIVANLSWGVGAGGKVLYVDCTSGGHYYIYLTGTITLAGQTANTNPPAQINAATSCQTADIETIKIWESAALAARLSGKFLQLWWTDNALRSNCVWEGPSARSIDSLNITGN